MTLKKVLPVVVAFVVGVLIGGFGWPASNLEERLHTNDIETQLAFEKFLGREDVLISTLANETRPWIRLSNVYESRLRGGVTYSFGQKITFRGIDDDDGTTVSINKLQGIYVSVYARNLGKSLDEVISFWLPLSMLPKIKTGQGLLKTLAQHGLAYHISGNSIWFPEYVPREQRMP